MTSHPRPAQLADVPVIARLRAANSGTEEHWRERIAGYLAGTQHPREALAPRVVLVAEEGETVVGLIAGHLTRRFGCDGELEWIDVAREKRGSGIADLLLFALAAWFVAQRAARVCVDVVPDNARARRFYARHGARELAPSWMVWDDIAVVGRTVR